MKPKRLPKFLQPFLWSVRIDDLDVERDKVYIIHQLLAFGNIEALQWLFRAYPISAIREVFLRRPMKIYRDAAYHFVTGALLRLRKNIPAKRYVAAPF